MQLLPFDRPIHLDRHDSAFGRWEFARARPPAALARYVIEYQGYREASHPIVRREVPSGHVSLIINLGPPFDVRYPHDPDWVSYGSFVAGLDDGYALVASAGLSYCLQVDLTAVGAYRYFGFPLHPLARRVTTLTDIFGRDADLLVEQLSEAPGWAPRFALLDAYLLRRFADGSAADPAVMCAYNELTRSHGSVRIDQLAANVQQSREHLSRRFTEQLGLSPKAFGRVLRFQHALEWMRADPAASMAAVAATCGYADQSHLARDFNALAGCPPSELAPRIEPDGLGIIELR